MPLFIMARKGGNIHDWIVKIFLLRPFLCLLFWCWISKAHARLGIIIYCVALRTLESAWTSVIFIWSSLQHCEGKNKDNCSHFQLCPLSLDWEGITHWWSSRKRSGVSSSSFRLFPLGFTGFSTLVKCTQNKKSFMENSPKLPFVYTLLWKLDEMLWISLQGNGTYSFHHHTFIFLNPHLRICVFF